MAYIQPNSTIEFFSDLNLSDNYENTLYFPSEQSKNTYFDNLTPIARVLNCTYTRENRGFVRVEVPISTLIGASYMRFKNTSFENKWFYAFVKNVDYVNNQTTQVQFMIDKMMTWMGVFTLNQCYIARQHTLNDGIGNNIAEEGIDVGEYIVEWQEDTVNMGQMPIILVHAAEDISHSTGGGVNGGLYCGCDITSYSNPSLLNAKLKELLIDNKIRNIVRLYQYPIGWKVDTQNPSPQYHDYQFGKPYTTIGSYTPRNNKLFCYPYKYVEVDNMEGATQEYMYEYFNTVPDQTSQGNIWFRVYGYAAATSEMALVPMAYKRLGENWEERLGMDKFPECAFPINTYEAYLAQKNAYLEQNVDKAFAKTAVNVGSKVLTGALIGAAAGSLATPVGTGVGAIIGGANGFLYGLGQGAENAMQTRNITANAEVGLTDVFGLIAENSIERKVRPTSPTITRGAVTSDLLCAEQVKTFRVVGKCITPNYAKMIDDFFTLFGYAVKQVGTPNMNARPNWTYVKTIGCSVGGSIPADDAKDIEKIFDNGIRFWKNHNNIGNYSLNNAPANS